MRIMVTGQSGLGKATYLEEVKRLLEREGKSMHIETLGRRMIRIAGEKITETTILNIPVDHLATIRKCALREFLKEADSLRTDFVVLNSHAVFRWHHGLIPALDVETIRHFKPDLIVCLIDDAQKIRRGLQERGTDFLAFWELFAWREEEIWISKMLADASADISGKRVKFYLIPKAQGPELLARILLNPERPKVYASFPITGLSEEEEKEVASFREELKEHVIVFDPYAIRERSILSIAYTFLEEVDEDMVKEYQRLVQKNFSHLKEASGKITDPSLGSQDLQVSLGTNLQTSKWAFLSSLDFTLEGAHIAGDELRNAMEAIDSQIISRDYLLIDQSDFVIMYIKPMENKPRPLISAGSQSEMVYAYSRGKPVYVVYKYGAKHLSPWVTQYATVFRTLQETLNHIL